MINEWDYYQDADYETLDKEACLKLQQTKAILLEDRANALEDGDYPEAEALLERVDALNAQINALKESIGW